jgi:hypothetical protein
MIVEEAISFDGFSMPASEQPQVFRKDGKPYDMNDPDFPIIRGHKFTNNYWAMPIMDSSRLKYIEERWKYFNQTRFHNELQPCKFALLKDMNAWRMKRRGDWTGALRRLRVSPNLFNSPHEGWINRILLHEMCHQYCFEKFGKAEKENKGHGPLWKAAMQMISLPPLQYDYEQNETYTDPFEKRVMEKTLDKRAKFNEDFPNGFATWDKIEIGEGAIFEDAKGVRHVGLIADIKRIGNDLVFSVITDAKKGSWLRWKMRRILAKRPPPSIVPNKDDLDWANAIKDAKKL